MTEERLRALHALVAAAQEWARWQVPAAIQGPSDVRLLAALAAVEACGADIAVVVELTGEGVRRLDAERSGDRLVRVNILPPAEEA